MLQITNLTRRKINEKIFQEVFSAAQKILKGKIKETSLVLTDNERIKEINKKYRRKNEITDVLSFEELNEIFISLSRAQAQARERKIGLNCELTRLFVHGIVHLAGYDHEKSAKKAERMFAIEGRILRSLK